MSHALKEIRLEIAERRTAIDAKKTEIEEAEALIERLRAEVAHETASIDALGRAAAVLKEHQPTTPAPASPAKAPRSPEIDESIRTRHAIDAVVAPAVEKRAATGGRHAKDPTKVSHKNMPTGVVKRGRARAVPAHEGGGLTRTDVDNPSPTLVARAELAVEVIREQGGQCTQQKVAMEMAELLDCDYSSAQAITTECLAILNYWGTIEYTNEKGEDRNGRKTSPIWRAVTSTATTTKEASV